MSIEHDAFFSFYRPQVALPIKTGGEVLGVPMSIGKHRRGRPGKAGVDYQGHTGRRVQRRGGSRLAEEIVSLLIVRFEVPGPAD